MSLWEPSQADLKWTEENINRLKEGGIWVIPSACASIQCFHKTKTYTARKHRPEDQLEAFCAERKKSLVEVKRGLDETLERCEICLKKLGYTNAEA